MRLVAEKNELGEFFTLRDGEDGAVPIFQITRIARALTQLGRPELIRLLRRALQYGGALGHS